MNSIVKKTIFKELRIGGMDMITCSQSGEKYRKPLEFFGLSTDTDPTGDIPNGSTLYYMDTKAVKMYDEENERWLAQ